MLERIGQISCCCACVVNLAVIGLGIAVSMVITDSMELATLDFSVYTQISTDWTTAPPTSITIRPASQGCLNNESPLFEKLYAGSYEGCSNNGRVITLG